MRSALIFLLLAGCATTGGIPKIPVHTITLHDTKQVYPPSQLYNESGCVHAPRPAGDTVGDMTNALGRERAQLRKCRIDRKALRTWETQARKVDGAK